MTFNCAATILINGQKKVHSYRGVQHVPDMWRWLERKHGRYLLWLNVYYRLEGRAKSANDDDSWGNLAASYTKRNPPLANPH